MKAKRILILSILMVLMGHAAVPAYADDSASERRTELVLHAGSPELLVDGLPVEILAPYVAQDSTMVPMSVFTRVLGADLKLGNHRTITLTTPTHRAVVAIGSPTATVNGATLQLPAAPAVKDGYAYLPVRLLEAFGGEIAYDPVSREIAVAIDVADGAGSGGFAIDSDAGKTGIGDSHYHWTMSYPSGLIQEYQSDSGDSLIFRDLKKEFYLGIFVEPEPEPNPELGLEPLTAEDRRERLYEYVEGDETIVDKATVEGASYTYDRITTKDKTGFYYEMRGLQSGGYFYIVIYGKKAASLADLRQHSRILDSFAPTFDPDDRTVKNLAKRQEALTKFKNEDYGLSLELPQSWEANEQVGTPYFSPSEEDAYLWMRVTSLQPGDTVEAWIDRSVERFERIFAETYREAAEISDVTWNGAPARMVKLSYSLDTEVWWEEYEIYAIHGDYRYYTEFAYVADSEASDTDYEALLADILDSMAVDYETVESHFGEIPDETDMLDMTLTTRKTNRTYGYSLQVPRFWSVPASTLDSDEVEFTFLGGTLSVLVVEELDDPQAAMDEMREHYLDSFADEEDVNVLSDTQVTFAGQSARKLVVEDASNVDRAPSRDTAYLFAHGDRVYIVHGSYNLVNGTDFVIGQLEAAMDSFRLTDE